MMTLALRTELRSMVRRLHRVEVRRGRDDLEDDDDDRSCDGESNKEDDAEVAVLRERVVDLVSSSSPSPEVELLPLFATMEKFGSGLRWQAPALTAAAAPRCAVRSLH